MPQDTEECPADSASPATPGTRPPAPSVEGGDASGRTPLSKREETTTLDGRGVVNALQEYILHTFTLFAQPLLALAKTDEELNAHLAMAGLLWNLELLPEGRRGVAEESVATLLSGGGQDPEAYASALNLIQKMRQRREQIDPHRCPVGIGRCSIRRDKRRRWVISAEIVPMLPAQRPDPEPAPETPSRAARNAMSSEFSHLPGTTVPECPVEDLRPFSAGPCSPGADSPPPMNS